MSSTDKRHELRSIVKEIYSTVARLESLYPGRHFTPDGHMVGSLGEVVATEMYDIELYEASHPVHDGHTHDGRKVQVKATQGSKVGIGDEPEYLIVLKLDADGEFSEIYNGRGNDAWNNAGKMQKNGQRHISLSKLKALDSQVAEHDRIPKRHHQ